MDSGAGRRLQDRRPEISRRMFKGGNTGSREFLSPTGQSLSQKADRNPGRGGGRNGVSQMRRLNVSGTVFRSFFGHAGLLWLALSGVRSHSGSPDPPQPDPSPACDFPGKPQPEVDGESRISPENVFPAEVKQGWQRRKDLFGKSLFPRSDRFRFFGFYGLSRGREAESPAGVFWFS